MEIFCGRCKKHFECKEDMILEKSNSLLYLKCPYCQKVLTHQKDASVPFFIPTIVRQQLYDLGYSRWDVDNMTPQTAQEIIQKRLCKSRGESKQESLSAEERGQLAHEIVGWLIVHDEQTKPQTLELKPGHNYIGRKSESKPVPLGIETDDLAMSRWHCDIEVTYNDKLNDYDFIIHDMQSRNGTILNGRVQRKLHEKDLIYLNNNDTFQLGITKIAFRKNSGIQKKEKVVKEVLDSPYQPTLVVSKDKIEHLYK
ncbi:FHA domain-containing protein [Chitinophagaceae bacterium LB-8]|uniref:FHA domain-containing protein n=1 Tax=Paraflavisolibacter caeni TaxID=2982496 RepID=A0A9X3B8J0_9BACT|nr:FHA domain-containing protein [Paraflavisolibacter caeni]MCU7549846.1 FHA domain-containing protein [Paraflavisolibacter caeni]